MEPQRQRLDPPEDTVHLISGRPPLHPNRKPMELQQRGGTHSLSSNAISSSSIGMYSWRKMTLLFILVAFTIILLIVSNKEDVAIERGIEIGEVEVVHRDVIKAAYDEAFDEKAGDDASTLDSVEKSTESSGVQDDSDRSNDAIKSSEESTKPDSDEENSAKESNIYESSGSSSQNKRFLLGFHAPSPQNFITSNIYLKPKGVGYPLRPIGGLHPLYAVDLLNKNGQSTTTTSSTTDITEINTTITGLSPESQYNAQLLGDYASHSPYADVRLKLTAEERESEQELYMQKLSSIKNDWGVWNFVDAKAEERPVVDWDMVGKDKTGYDVLSGEIESGEFGDGVWQGDDEYIKNFLTEAKALISRVKEAIYAEYGLPSSTLTPEQLQQRNIQLGIHTVKASDPAAKSIDAAQGVAWMHESSFEALAKKLLNAMMTNDHFFVTLGGHSAAAGHGNNFHQSYMMQFQEVMEPVFDRLGMVLVSANRAQGGMGTLQAALAGETIYGQKDVVLWDSSMTEKGGGNQDLFHRQMLLTGHRVPILLDMGGGKGTMDAIHTESGAHVGGITLGTPSIFATTKSVEQAETLPFALRHLFCENGVTTCTDAKYKYAAACWTDRSDIEPGTAQNEAYGSQVSWHPGNRSHQWVGRKLSLLFLHALEEAINVWENAASSDGNPIPGKFWHLSEEENTIREKLRSVDVSATECGKMMTQLPRVCNTPMKGATEWAPRADPEHSSIRGILKPAPNGYVPVLLGSEPLLYGGRDPHMLIQKIPDGEIDVPAIARSIPVQADSQRLLLRNIQQLQLSSNLQSDASKQQPLRKQQARQLGEIVPGEGWAVEEYAPGFCDGTSNQVCNRAPAFNCLMSGHGDSRGQMVGDALSGWLTFQLKDVSQGIFAGRIQYWHNHNSNKRTEGWTDVNNGRNDARRFLKPPPPPLPDDFRLEVAVDGELRHAYTGDEFKNLTEPHIAYNVPFTVLLDDEEMAKKNEKRDMEVSLRIVGGGRESVLGITHIYYA